ncbi:MAG: glycosyltransferase [Bacteroidales bacterium]
MVNYQQTSFHQSIKSEFEKYTTQNELVYPEIDTIRIDLHCHDHNSNVPDELLGRILNVPETWLPTENLLKTLRKHGMQSFTITNHNNARSCFDLLNKGEDILVGAEFSCTVPEYQTGIHVLTYGFTPEQEVALNKHRRNLYSFLDYTLENDLPTIWAHPLYHYKKNGSPPLDFFYKLALLFERFEVINGQRDTWQNLLVKRFLETLTKEKIHEIADKFHIEPDRFTKNPYKKSQAGGSDSHMGIFSGLTGSLLYIPDFEQQRKQSSISELALKAIKAGDLLPFGGHNNSEKMMITFLDYFCQIALYSKDPGLLRILLHKGEPREKINAFLISNGFAELRQHKITMKFIQLFHDSLTGVEPHFAKRWLIPSAYKPIFDQSKKMAQSFRQTPVKTAETYQNSMGQIYNMLWKILSERIKKKNEEGLQNLTLEELNLNNFITHFELPSELRSFLGPGKLNGKMKTNGIKPSKLSNFLDGLSFPFLASSIILSAHFTSAKVLYNSRNLLTQFSDELNYLKHPKRMLWLTDTWDDNNGVSMVLKSILSEIRERNLPIDILICSEYNSEENNLIVVKPVMTINIPFYKSQKINIPNYLDIHHKFLSGEYDRVICSTEGPMGLAALYLKHAYTVPAYFYLHTDWLTFSKKVLKLEKENTSRFRRLLRAYYKSFDGVFVLNTDHFSWLTNNKMDINNSQVFLTAHWTDSYFHPVPADKKKYFNIEDNAPVILFAGRISHEKGVMELPVLYNSLKSVIPNIKIVITGNGPAENELRNALPDGIFMGWKDHQELPAIYSAADILVLPSQFDTFSCVVLEAFSCGLPVIAYNTKGPKDIINHGENGFLVHKPHEMTEYLISYFQNTQLREKMKTASRKRADDYTSDQILQKFLKDTGINEN